MDIKKILTPYLSRNRYTQYTNNTVGGNTTIINEANNTEGTTITNYLPATATTIVVNGVPTDVQEVTDKVKLDDTIYTTDINVNEDNTILIGNVPTDNNTNNAVYYNDTTLADTYVASKLGKFQRIHCTNLEVASSITYNSIAANSVETDTLNVVLNSWLGTSSGHSMTLGTTETASGHTTLTTYGLNKSYKKVGNTWVAGDFLTTHDIESEQAEPSETRVASTRFVADYVNANQAIDITCLFTGEGKILGRTMLELLNSTVYMLDETDDQYLKAYVTEATMHVGNYAIAKAVGIKANGDYISSNIRVDAGIGLFDPTGSNGIYKA